MKNQRLSSINVQHRIHTHSHKDNELEILVDLGK